MADSTCCEPLKDEFSLSRLLLTIEEPAAFIYPQWSIKRFPRWIFKIWKVTIALYFSSWLALSLVMFHTDYPLSGEDKWLVYLTHWTFVVFVAYLVISAINACGPHTWNFKTYLASGHEIAVTSVCGRRTFRSLWPLQLQWLLWNVAVPTTTAVVLLYWTVLWPASPLLSAMNLHVHLINGLVLVLDQLFHAMPMRLLHIYQPVTYGAAYALFTGAYFAGNGTDPLGEKAIYAFLDYGSNTSVAIGADCGVVLVLVPSIWLFHFLIYRLRQQLWLKFGSDSPQVLIMTGQNSTAVLLAEASVNTTATAVDLEVYLEEQNAGDSASIPVFALTSFPPFPEGHLEREECNATSRL